MGNVLSIYISKAQNMDDDDEFFHVTCHIDEGLRSKKAKGEFVGLEKLLPKDRASLGSIAANSNLYGSKP